MPLSPTRTIRHAPLRERTTGAGLTPRHKHRRLTLKLTTALRKTVLGTVAIATAALGFSLSQGAASAAPTSHSAGIPMVAAATWQAPRLTEMVTEAIHQTTLGVMYASGGGHGPSPAPLGSNVDCSGFVREMYGWAFHTDIGGGSSDDIRLSGEFTQTANPVPGDVALFGNGGQAPSYHAGIYLGLINGHPAAAAASQDGTPILIQQWYNRYWSGDLMGYWHYRGASAADSGPLTPPVAKPVPRPVVNGHFDAASGTPGGFRLSGWSVDPQRKGSSAPLAIVVDGRLIAHLPTPVARADVNRLEHASGNHGFNTAIPFATGRHTICVTARSAGTNSAGQSLGCRAVIVPGQARGAFDSATGETRTFTSRGWAFDPNDSVASTGVLISIDGRVITYERAAGVRSDVNRAFHIAGDHGFSIRIGTTRGHHTVCVMALRATTSSYSRNLGCRNITVAG